MKKIIGILTSICLILGITPAIYANTSETTEPERTEIASGNFDALESENIADSENEAMAASAIIIDAGTCGANAEWELQEDGYLYINGSGAMNDYTSTTMPWANYKNMITNVVIGNGITKIGTYSFYAFTNIQAVKVSDSVTNIANYAFSNCTSLQELSLGSKVSSIGTSAFSNCALLAVYLPESVKTISSYAFNMSSCLSMTVANSTASIGTNALSNQQDAVIYGNKGSTAETYAKNNHFNFVPRLAANGSSRLKWKIYDLPYDRTHAPATILEVTGRGNFPSLVNEGQCPWYDTGTDIKEIILGEEVSSNGNSFYYNSTYGTATVLNPNGNVSLRNPSGSTIYGFTGSPAEKYANSNNAHFVPITKTSGTTGTVKWSYYSGVGLLKLDGYGATASFNSVASVPWYVYRASIKKIIIGDNVNFISNNAFYGMTGLETLIINNPVTVFGVDTLTAANSSVRVYGTGNAKLLAEIYAKSYYPSKQNLQGYMFPNNRPSEDYRDWTLYTTGLLDIDGKGSFENYTTDTPAPWIDYSNIIKTVSVGEKITEIGANFLNLPNAPVTVNIYNPSISINEAAFGSQFIGTLCGYGNSTTEYYAYDYNYNFEPFADAGAMNSLYWRMEDGGILRIGGTGPIINYSSVNMIPWYSYRSQIKNIIIEQGVTRIGNNSFNGCSNLISITIQNPSLTLGSNVFANTNATFKIVAREDSVAHTYAVNNGYNFAPLL